MSAASQTPEFVIIGQIVKPHGVRGALKVLPLTDDPKRFSSLTQVYLGEEDRQGEPVGIKKVQFQAGNIILTLENINSREEAELWRRQYVQIPAGETMPLPDGAYYFYQLIGLKVITNAGDVVGVVEDVASYPANDVFVVVDSEREYLIPDIPDVIEKVDVDAGEIIINPIPGLLD